MTVPHVADGHGIRSLAHVPKRYLAAGQAARQTLPVPVVKLQSDDWARRLHREERDGGVLCERAEVIYLLRHVCVRKTI